MTSNKRLLLHILWNKKKYQEVHVVSKLKWELALSWFFFGGLKSSDILKLKGNLKKVNIFLVFN